MRSFPRMIRSWVSKPAEQEAQVFLTKEEQAILLEELRPAIERMVDARMLRAFETIQGMQQAMNPGLTMLRGNNRR